MDRFHFVAELWIHDDDPPWHFITVPPKISDEIDERSSGKTGGFGSVRVRVTVGATAWKTSLFPDSKRGAYLLPVKAEVRRKERLSAGSQVSVDLELLVD